MHPSHDKLSGFVLGTLDDRQADVISQHLEVCADCESTMRELDKVSDTIIGELQQGLNGSFHAEPGYQKMLASIDAIGAESWPGSRDEGVSPDGVDEPAQAELQSVGVYEVLSKLGDGGMGTVYRAFHTKLKREVALKVLRPDRLRTSEAITRFEREMEAVGKLDHPNIVRATDAGEVDGGYFLVMELLAGIDLSKLAARCGPLGSADACELVRQAAVGLQHAHLHGLVHRDIKPSNLMLTVGQVSNLPSTGETSGRLEPCPTVKILDLGLATLGDRQFDPAPSGDAASSDPEVTAVEQVLGTLAYMAPEQVRCSRSVDIRADVFSLGATLYKLLTGEHYRAIDASACIDRLPVGVSPELRSVIQRMLASNPDDRFATPHEVSMVVKPFAESANLAALLEQAVGGNTSREDIDNQPAVLRNVRSDHGAENNRQTRHAARDSGFGRRRITARAASLAGLLLLGIVFYVTTDNGQLVVQSEIDGVQVFVKRGAEVADDFRISTEGKTTRLRSGEYTIEVPDAEINQVHVDRNHVTLSRGGREVVRITRLEAGESVPGHPAAASAAHRRSELTVLETDLQQNLSNDPYDVQVKSLRERFVDYRHRHYGTSESVKAARLMATLPWPADALRREEIDQSALQTAGHGDAANAPAELVAVLGDGKMQHWLAPNTVGFSPDGKSVVSIGSNGTLREWDAATGEQTSPVQVLGYFESRSALSPDRSRVAIAFWNTILLLDRRTGEQRELLDLQQGRIEYLMFSPDGERVVVGGDDGHVRVIDFDGGSVVRSFRAHDGEIYRVAFSPDGNSVASAARQGPIKLWTLDGELKGELPGFRQDLLVLKFNPAGDKVVARYFDRTLKIFDVASRTCQHTVLGNGEKLWAAGLAFSPDGKLVASQDRVGVKIWNVETAKVETVLSPVRADTEGLEFSPDGARLVVAGGEEVMIWDVLTGQQINAQPTAHRGRVSSIDVSAGGDVIAAATGISAKGAEKSIRLWDLRSRRLIRSWDENAVQTNAGGVGWTNKIAFIPGRKELATAFVNVTLWEADTGSLLATLLPRGPNQMHLMAVEPRGRYVAGGSAQCVFIWDVKTNELIRRIPIVDVPGASSMTFSTDGNTMIIGRNDGLITFWDLGTGKPGHVLPHESLVTALAVSPDGSLLASVGHGHTIRLWDVATGALHHTLGAHSTDGYPRFWNQLASVAFSPDGSLLASSAFDGMVRLWDPRTGAQLKSISLCPAYGLISEVRFTPDGRHVITANGNGTVYVLRLQSRGN